MQFVSKPEVTVISIGVLPLCYSRTFVGASCSEPPLKLTLGNSTPEPEEFHGQQSRADSERHRNQATH
jgi:hypothetical protein